MKWKPSKTRLLWALGFVLLSGCMMFGVYRFSAENASVSNQRSEMMMELIRDQVAERLESTEKGQVLSEKLQSYIISVSPYGNDWNSNVRKAAHFGLYLLLGAGLYITLTILGCPRLARFACALLICFFFAFFDEYHQLFSGRTASFHDVILDFAGALTGVLIMQFLAMCSTAVRYIHEQIETYYRKPII